MPCLTMMTLLTVTKTELELRRVLTGLKMMGLCPNVHGVVLTVYIVQCDHFYYCSD